MRNLWMNGFGILVMTLLVSASAVAQDSQAENASNSASGFGEAAATGEGTSVASPAPETMSSSQPVCVPACRSGFLCYQGYCISACNPPCAEGQYCGESGECIASQPAMIAPAPAAPATIVFDVRDQAVLDKLRVRAERRELRMKYRLVPRFTFHTAFFAADVDRAEFLAVALGFGFRKWVASFFSLQGRVTLAIGRSAIYGGYGDDDVVSTFGISGDIAPLFGPFGRFYVGPIFGMQSFIYTEHPTYMDNYQEERWTLKNQLLGTFGLEAGILLGDRDQFDISARVRTDMEFDEDFIMELAFGIHIMPKQEN